MADAPETFVMPQVIRSPPAPRNVKHGFSRPHFPPAAFALTLSIAPGDGLC